jgi:hypothetical protein
MVVLSILLPAERWQVRPELANNLLCFRAPGLWPQDLRGYLADPFSTAVISIAGDRRRVVQADAWNGTWTRP